MLTGATGYVGEGVLLECMADPAVDEVLVVGRKSCGVRHAKVNELLVPDFFSLASFADQLRGYDACFFCAGISSVGMNETDYTLSLIHICGAKTILRSGRWWLAIDRACICDASSRWCTRIE